MTSNIENEIKLTLVDGDSTNIIKKILADPLISGGNVFISEHYTDYYFDTEDEFFYRSSDSLRIREFNDGKRRLMYKSFISDTDGILSRRELEKSVDIQNEEAIRLIMEEMFPERNIETKHVLTIETHRRMLNAAQYYTLCIDDCDLIDPSNNEKIKSFVEIEFESINNEIEYSDDIKRFSSEMESSFGMSMVTDNKFKRGYAELQKLHS